MSVNLTRRAWETPARDLKAKIVLLALADMADSAGSCHPTLHRLGFITGLTVDEVVDAIMDLKMEEHIREHEGGFDLFPGGRP